MLKPALRMRLQYLSCAAWGAGIGGAWYARGEPLVIRVILTVMLCGAMLVNVDNWVDNWVIPGKGEH